MKFCAKSSKTDAQMIQKKRNNRRKGVGFKPTSDFLKKAVEDRAKQLVYEMPRYLWD